MNIEEKVWLLVKQFQKLTGRLNLRLIAGIEQFYWNQGEKVAHFDWFGEPWWKIIFQLLIHNDNDKLVRERSYSQQPLDNT